jgi:hypothetical protein
MVEAIEISLSEFINGLSWTFAKTMPEWPHEYIVRKNVDEGLFIQLVIFIRKNGYNGKFYTKNIPYLDYGGYVYWTMGAPLEDTTIINRCRKEDSYEYRLQRDFLD